MLKAQYHPNAYLLTVKNIKPGLQARTSLLTFLEKKGHIAKDLATTSKLSYRAVSHHLRLLEKAGIVKRKRGIPHVWLITGRGQKRLINLERTL
jgi:DNA-binding transcriptional ArsR family regulator